LSFQQLIPIPLRAAALLPASCLVAAAPAARVAAPAVGAIKAAMMVALLISQAATALALAVLAAEASDDASAPPALVCDAPRWCQPQPQRAVTVRRDMQYDTTNDLRLDIYTAAGGGWDGSLTRRPAIVVVHGGGFHDGGKNESNIVKMSTQLAQHGFVAAAINYRLLLKTEGVSGKALLAAAEDTRTAVRWLVGQAEVLHIDTGRIAAFGESAGAITSTILPYLRLPAPGPQPRGNISCAVSLSGMLYTTGLGSGMVEFNSSSPALLELHGSADPSIPIALAEVSAARLAAKHAPHWLVKIPGGVHEPYAQLWNRSLGFEQQMYGFLVRELRLNSFDDESTVRRSPALTTASTEEESAVTATDTPHLKYFGVWDAEQGCPGAREPQQSHNGYYHDPKTAIILHQENRTACPGGNCVVKTVAVSSALECQRQCNATAECVAVVIANTPPPGPMSCDLMYAGGPGVGDSAHDTYVATWAAASLADHAPAAAGAPPNLTCQVAQSQWINFVFTSADPLVIKRYHQAGMGPALLHVRETFFCGSRLCVDYKERWAALLASTVKPMLQEGSLFGVFFGDEICNQ
jgi:acetyl esterase/lipase